MSYVIFVFSFFFPCFLSYVNAYIQNFLNAMIRNYGNSVAFVVESIQPVIFFEGLNV